MKQALAIIGVAATAIAATVKAVEAISGAKWLHRVPSWHSIMIGYFWIGIVLYSLFILALMVRPLPFLQRQFALDIRPVKTRLPVAIGMLLPALVAFALVRMGARWIAVTSGYIVTIYSLYVVTISAFVGYTAVKLRKKKCPFCLETIHVDATRCKHCHGELEPRTRLILPPGVDR